MKIGRYIKLDSDDWHRFFYIYKHQVDAMLRFSLISKGNRHLSSIKNIHLSILTNLK